MIDTLENKYWKMFLLLNTQQQLSIETLTNLY